MAKTTNINGVDIPAWASETTLATMLQSSQKSNHLTKAMMQGVTKQFKLSEAVKGALAEQVETSKKNAKTDQAQELTKTDMLLEGVGAVNKVAGFFGNAEKPMSGLVGAVKGMVGSLKGPSGQKGLSNLFKRFPALEGVMKGFGVALDIGADIFLTAAGWNAAKFEQFAEVQKKMIDSGAIFYETAGSFDELYSQSFKAGVTYNAFADTIGNFGGTMTALGGDVSRGSRNFLGLYKHLQGITEQYGDLGYQNKDLMGAYAAYIESQRLTGGIERQLADQGRLLNMGFIDMTVQATALASLTSLNRGDIMARQISAMSETFAAAGLQKLDENGQLDQKAAATDILGQLALMDDPISAQILESLQRNLDQYGDNISNIDMFQGLDGDVRAVVMDLLKGTGDELNEYLQTGFVDGEKPQDGMWLLAMKDIDMTKFVQTGSSATLVSMIQEWQNASFIMQQNFQSYYEKEANGTLADYIAKTATNMDVAGTTVEAMNSAQEMFLKLQNAITLPVNKLSFGLESISDWFEHNSGVLKKQARKFLGHGDDNPTRVSMGEKKLTNEDKAPYEKLIADVESVITNSYVKPTEEKWIRAALEELERSINNEETNEEINEAYDKVLDEIENLTNSQLAIINADEKLEMAEEPDTVENKFKKDSAHTEILNARREIAAQTTKLDKTQEKINDIEGKVETATGLVNRTKEQQLEIEAKAVAETVREGSVSLETQKALKLVNNNVIAREEKLEEFETLLKEEKANRYSIKDTMNILFKEINELRRLTPGYDPAEDIEQLQNTLAKLTIATPDPKDTVITTANAVAHSTSNNESIKTAQIDLTNNENNAIILENIKIQSDAMIAYLNDKITGTKSLAALQLQENILLQNSKWSNVHNHKANRLA
tara:strand:- start:862 stop:3531 length:2670 start_codon:yes stop_codon:yes gene_type:complete